MSQNLGRSSSDSLGGGCSSPAFLASTPKSLSKSAGRPASDDRNQCITDFFKPAPKQEKRNEKAGLPVSCTEPLRKIYSPKQNRRKKLPIPSSNRSPIIDAFLRVAKLEKKDKLDNGGSVTRKAMYPKIVARQLFKTDGSSDSSFKLKDHMCTKNLERSEIYPVRTRTPLVENSRECKMDCVDLDTTGSGLSKWASTSKNDSLKKDDHTYCCQKTNCSKTPQPSQVSSSSQLLPEAVCRETQVKEKKIQSKQQLFDSVKKYLGISFSNQDASDPLGKRLCSSSWEPSSAALSSVQVSKAACSSGWDSNKIINMRESQSCPSAYPNSRPLLDISKQREHSEKRKRISSKKDMKNSQKSIVQRFDTHDFSSSSLENHNSGSSKGRMPSDGDKQAESLNPSDNDLPFSVECLDVEENRYNCTTDCQIQIATTKESQMQIFPLFNSAKLSQEVGIKISSSESTASQEMVFSKRSNKSESHMQHNSFSEALKMQVHKEHPPLASTLPSKKNAEPPVLLGDDALSSGGCDPVTIHSSSSNLNEDGNLKACMLNRKPTEDDTSGSNLDSSDEEILVPLEKMLAQSTRPSVEDTEQRNECDTTETKIESQNINLSIPSFQNISYMNHLEHLLKEKEEFRRIDELEQQLQQVKQQVEINCQNEEDSNDGELSAEHRAFLERFSVISDAIPDQHPGENIFQVAHAGKIFSQHNLDLRNSGFHPQNPIEKYLLGSEITQQLFVIIEGLLKSAYHNSPCPAPILKWMFQMMSIHPDSSVSRKILDMLMTLTIKNSSASDDQPRPWIPSLFDITAVLVNMGVPFSALFPLQHFQPTFSEGDIMSEMCETTRKQPSGDLFGNSTPFFFLIDTNLCSIAKFLRLCISIHQEAYTDKEIFLLLLMLFKLSLEKELKQFPLVDLECLIIKLLENIRDWDTKMTELCVAISCLSNHHHDLLWLVQFVPNWITRGRQVRRHLSLVVISKLLKNHVNIPNSYDQQMKHLCKDLEKMKPSNLLKRFSKTMEHHDGLSKEYFLSEFEPEAYYLTYVLLHLVREASNSEVTSSNQREWLLKLCSILEKHVKCDIREDARLFYKTKVKDLVARTYSKWQQMIHSSQLTQGQIHDFWIPDF